MEFIHTHFEGHMPEEVQWMDGCVYLFSAADAAVENLSLEEIRCLRKHNPSRLLGHYRRTGQKDQAVSLLFSMRRPGKTIEIAKEIINTYIYFEDYEGALDYIKHYERTSDALLPIECLIRVHLLFGREDSGDDIFQLVQAGLSSAYTEALVKALVYYHRRRLGTRFLGGLKPKLEKLNLLFTDSYTESLRYSEAKFLYRIMPDKARFLKQMVRRNPYIKKKYYLAYARIFGVQRDDISRILTTRCVYWALKIAIRRKWVSHEMRASLERRLGNTPIFINRSGDWSRRPDKCTILFLRGKVINEHFYGGMSELSSDLGN